MSKGFMKQVEKWVLGDTKGIKTGNNKVPYPRLQPSKDGDYTMWINFQESWKRAGCSQEQLKDSMKPFGECTIIDKLVLKIPGQHDEEEISTHLKEWVNKAVCKGCGSVDTASNPNSDKVLESVVCITCGAIKYADKPPQ